jgi:hypothetical protein
MNRKPHKKTIFLRADIMPNGAIRDIFVDQSCPELTVDLFASPHVAGVGTWDIKADAAYTRKTDSERHG